MDNLPKLLEVTVLGDPATIAQATKQLINLENADNFTIKLLEIIHSNATPMPIKQSAGLYFKNLIAKRWPAGSDNPISEEEKNRLKSFIIQLMVTAPNIIQKQLTEGLTIMSVHDFPHKWPNLIPDLIQQLNVSQAVDFNRIVGTLKTLNSIVYRFRNAPNTEEVNIELKIILDALAAPLLAFFRMVEGAVASNENNEQTINIFHCLLLISKIFFSLSYVDLPEHFENDLAHWMSIFRKLLNYNSSNIKLLAREDDEDKAGILVKLKISIIDIIRLYVEKYEEPFTAFTKDFVADIWGLLLAPYDNERYNRLVSVGINFLTIVCTSIFYEIFNNKEALMQICEKVITPNMVLMESDQENFENDPVEYIRADIEGSDSDTRRRCAYNLVKGLRKHFQLQITELFANYITSQLQLYSSDPKKHWSCKDVSIYLVTALTISGETADKGTTRINEFIPLLSFYQTHIFPELTSYPKNHPVIQADALKFLTSFRNILPEEEVKKAFPFIVNMLSSADYVVSTYAAHSIERILHSQIVKREMLAGGVMQLYTPLFGKLKDKDSKDNEYIIKCVMRVTSIIEADILPHAEAVLNELSSLLKRIIESPSNPEFNHFLFESIAAFIKSVYSPDRDYISALEPFFLSNFEVILSKELTSFTPYVFQLMAELISFNPNFTDVHMQIMTQIVTKGMWNSSGNIPALVKLVKTMISKGSAKILAANKLVSILGIVQKLILSSTTDQFAFRLLDSLIDHYSFEQFKAYIAELIKLFFTRIKKNKTVSFLVNFMACISRMILRYGDVNNVLAIIESVQPQITKEVLGVLWAPNFMYVTNNLDKKIIFHASVLILFSSAMTSPLLSPLIFPFYSKMLESLRSKKPSMPHLPSISNPNIHFSDSTANENDFDNFKISKTSYVRLINATTKEPEQFADLVFDAEQFANNLQSRYNEVYPNIQA